MFLGFVLVPGQVHTMLTCELDFLICGRRDIPFVVPKRSSFAQVFEANLGQLERDFRAGRDNLRRLLVIVFSLYRSDVGSPRAAGRSTATSKTCLSMGLISRIPGGRSRPDFGHSKKRSSGSRIYEHSVQLAMQNNQDRMRSTA